MKEARGTFASLSSSLLARKGHARPAMRPNSGQSLEDLGWNDHGHDHDHDDARDHDHGHGHGLEQGIAHVHAHPHGVTDEGAAGEPPAPIRYQAQITANFSRPEELVAPDACEDAAEHMAEADAETEMSAEAVEVPVKPLTIRRRPRAVAQPVAPAVAGTKAAFTLRLDERRHLRLRLACAMLNRSGQQIVAEALDQYLDSVAGLEDLATRMPNKGSKGHN